MQVYNVYNIQLKLNFNKNSHLTCRLCLLYPQVVVSHSHHSDMKRENGLIICCPQAFLGHFLGGANNLFLPKFNPVLPKNYPLRRGQVLQFCSAKLMYHSFESHCSASLNIGQKLLNDDSKTGKNGRKQANIWQKPNKNG